MITPTIQTITTKEEWLQYLQEQVDYELFDFYKNLDFTYFCQTEPEARFASKQDQDLLYTNNILKKQLSSNTFEGGCWVSMPWKKSCYHFLSADKMYTLRTLRNEGLVTRAEQLQLQNKKIGIIGLSVGKTVALSLVRYGIGNRYKLADSDTVDVTNLNRALFDLTELGSSKLDLTAQKMYQIDPFLAIEQEKNMLDSTRIEKFVAGCDLIIDTFDTFPVKLALRKIAKKKKIPVLSGVDLDRGMLLIVERYDSDPDLDDSLFLNKLSADTLAGGTHSKKEITDFFIKMIGRELHSERLLNTVKAVGEEYTSYPQLIVASQLFSAVMVCMSELILLGKESSSFRTHIDLPSILSTYT